ncbi:LysR family transcriptional regulator [Profundibacterium mesophilum]|uniref:Transcriptional regulator LysR family protein n=1 Tax=Profundibacterium mesophilum KAUST100406-0324 TaxID=1037889 RepID=A0A921NSS3_9RHOB|nr:LysR family transcriptional regulator [Profundibacterium mesophilum]KAF0674778.1 Transcriptional regulator LysR family protein [Profundibacterium mesophilum KAUST100406-0324]
MAINWDDLRIFLSVARQDSLSGAARELRLDPATVGRRVARLEAGLGAPLFVKSPQGYRLTEAGERLVRQAEQAELAIGAGTSEAAAAEEGLSGAIRLGAPDGCANFLLPQVCAQLCDAHPGLEVQIVALPRIVDLSRREADMAIAVSRPSSGRLTVQKISDYGLSLAAHQGYLDGAPPLQGAADLGAHRIAGYIPDMIFDSELDYLGALGVERVRLASNSVAVQFRWIAQGAGIGVVHDFALPQAPGLVRVLHEEISMTRTFWLVRHAGGRRAARHDRFAQALIGALRQEIARLEALA